MNAPNIDIPFSFQWVTAKLGVGSRPRTVADLQYAYDCGVSHMLNVCDVANPSGTLPYGYWNPAADDGLAKPVAWFQTSIDFALPIVISKTQRLLVNCFDGVDRSASTCYAILRALGLAHFDAKELIIRARFVTAAMRYCDDADAAVKALGYPTI